MPLNEAGAPALRAALTALIDYAGLFPPAQLSMQQSVAEYLAVRSGPFAWMLGRFIVPASRLDDLLANLTQNGGGFPLSVIVDAGSDPRSWLSNVQAILARLARVRAQERRVTIEALEAPLAPLLTQRETYDAFIGQFAASRQQSELRDVPAFLEVPRDARWANSLGSVMFALARHGLGGKIRCGGAGADAVPAPSDLAAFIHAANEERVPFKATAGLHHPVRHTDAASGTATHGFLNILAAATLARSGASADELTEVLACEDASRLSFGADVAATRREGFVSYGSCSFSEPVEDLQHLGML